MGYILRFAIFYSILCESLSAPVFYAALSPRIYEWSFGGPQRQILTPSGRPAERVYVDTTTRTTYWISSGNQDYIYKQVIGVESQYTTISPTPTGGAYVTSLWIDSPRHVYFTIGNTPNGLWRFQINDTSVLESVGQLSAQGVIVVDSTIFVFKSLELIKCLNFPCTQTVVVANRDPTVSTASYYYGTDLAVDYPIRRIYFSYGPALGNMRIYHADVDRLNQNATRFGSGYCTGLEVVDGNLFAIQYWDNIVSVLSRDGTMLGNQSITFKNAKFSHDDGSVSTISLATTTTTSVSTSSSATSSVISSTAFYSTATSLGLVTSSTATTLASASCGHSLTTTAGIFVTIFEFGIMIADFFLALCDHLIA